MAAAGLPVLGGACVVALRWLFIVVFDIKPFILPAPSDIARSFAQLPGYLMRQAWTTLTETSVNFGFASAAGLLTAMLLTASRTVERAASRRAPARTLCWRSRR
ncbi:MAG: NitT/TauT family transport system permease protein [Streptomycetaceae bacterium]|nr:NitT/TauT family transport system permease protein [Streptomycetaceae bacterium]